MSTIQLFNLIAKLSLDSDDYNAKIEEAKKKGQDLADTTKKKHAVSMAAGWAAVAAAIVAVIKKMADLALATAKYADQVGDLAEQWGFTTKQIQEFDYWATQNGTTLESLLTGMRGLVNQAEAGSSAFEKLGVSVKNADGTFKDQRTLFLETMTALQGVKDQVQRNALQFEIFGRAGIQLGAIINKSGAELEALSQKAEDYGLIISEKAIKASSDFNDELDTLKRQFQSTIAELLAGDPNEAYRKFEMFMDNLLEKLDNYLPKFLKFVVRFGMKVIEEIPKLIEPLIVTAIEEIVDWLTRLDWATILVKVQVAIIKGLLGGIVNTVKRVLSGEIFQDIFSNTQDNVQWFMDQPKDFMNIITSANVSEKTTKVDEKLDITLSVESDGTVAGQQNLDVISDLLTDKINKALGDMVNG